MIDLENLPQPDIFKLADFPGINADLIREKFAAGNVEYLISLFDFIQRSKHRAESLARAYFNQMEVLHKRLEAAKSGELPGLDTTRARERTKTREEKQVSTSREGKPVGRKPPDSLALDL